jgi:hypothetical protein
MPYTEEYDNLVKELFTGKIGEGSRVLPPLNLVCADQVIGTLTRPMRTATNAA